MAIDKNKYLSFEKNIQNYNESDGKKKQVFLEEFISFLGRNKYRESIPLVTGLKVVVVDDEAIVAETIGGIFSDHGFRVATATDAIKAGCLINSMKPQIVTIDLGMNVFSGLDVIKMIRELKLQEKMWVVVISGGTEKALQEAVELGADCYLQKPFAHSDLEKIISKFFPHYSTDCASPKAS